MKTKTQSITAQTISATLAFSLWCLVAPSRYTQVQNTTDHAELLEGYRGGIDKYPKPNLNSNMWDMHEYRLCRRFAQHLLPHNTYISVPLPLFKPFLEGTNKTKSF